MCLDSGQSMPGMTEYVFDRRATRRLVKQLDEDCKAAGEQLKHPVYSRRQGGLATGSLPQSKAAGRAGDGQAREPQGHRGRRLEPDPRPLRRRRPARENDDFDFEQTLRDTHTELADLNREAVELAARITQNFEELRI